MVVLYAYVGYLIFMYEFICHKVREISKLSLLVVMQLGGLVASWLCKWLYTQYRLIACFNWKASFFVPLTGSKGRPVRLADQIHSWQESGRES